MVLLPAGIVLLHYLRVLYIQGEKIKMITVDLLVEGGIFALLQHGLNPTFWTYILLIRHKKAQKNNFLFIK